MTLSDVLYTAAGLAVGFVCGLLVNVRWIRRPDGEPDVVKVSWSTRWQRAFYITIAALSVVSVALVAVHNNDTARITRDQQDQVARQTICNKDMVRAITVNAQVAQADRDNLSQLLSTITTEVLTPSGDRQAVVQQAFRRYADTEATNTAARKPYPAPNCGE